MPKIAFLGRYSLQLRMSLTEADAFFSCFFFTSFFGKLINFLPQSSSPPFYGKTAEEEKSVSIFVFFRGRPPRSQILFANISPEKSNGPSYGKMPTHYDGSGNNKRKYFVRGKLADLSLRRISLNANAQKSTSGFFFSGEKKVSVSCSSSKIVKRGQKRFIKGNPIFYGNVPGEKNDSGPILSRKKTTTYRIPETKDVKKVLYFFSFLLDISRIRFYVYRKIHPSLISGD